MKVFSEVMGYLYLFKLQNMAAGFHLPLSPSVEFSAAGTHSSATISTRGNKRIYNNIYLLRCRVVAGPLNATLPYIMLGQDAGLREEMITSLKMYHHSTKSERRQNETIERMNKKTPEK